MKIVIFGATGRTGVVLLEQALAEGHSVTALVRNPAKLQIQHPALRIVQGDALDAEIVALAVEGGDAVLSTLAPTPSSPDLMTRSVENILTAMIRHKIRRVVLQTGAGVVDPNDRLTLVPRVIGILLKLLAANVLRDSESAVERVRASDREWTIVRVPFLTDGPLTRNYRVGYVGKDAGRMISRADAADFMLRELNEARWMRKMPVVSY